MIAHLVLNEENVKKGEDDKFSLLGNEVLELNIGLKKMSIMFSYFLQIDTIGYL